MPALWPREDVSVDLWSYLALAGAALFTLLLVALSFEPRSRAEPESVGGALSLGLSLASLPCAAFAYWLAVATHHRPLGAATFAVFAFGSGVLLAWFVRRASAFAARSRTGKHLLRVCQIGAVLGVAALAFVAAGELVDVASAGTVALELATGLVLSALVLVLPVTPRLARAARWTAPACALLCALGVWLLRSDADVRATVKSAPVIAGAFGLALR